MGRHLAVGWLAQRASRPSRGPRAPPPPLGDGGPGERDRHREADRVDCARMVHLPETCDDDAVHLITHAMTTAATVHEARCTAAIHEALAGKGLAPGEHLVDSAYVDAELLVRGREDHGIALVGPGRPDPAWQTRVEGAFTAERFEVDWEGRRARCPRGKLSSGWREGADRTGRRHVRVLFRKADCDGCPARALCTRKPHQPRHLRLARHRQVDAGKDREAASLIGATASCGSFGARDLSPDREGLRPDGSVLGSRKVIAVKVKEVVDLVVGGEEPLRLAG